MARAPRLHVPAQSEPTCGAQGSSSRGLHVAHRLLSHLFSFPSAIALVISVTIAGRRHLFVRQNPIADGCVQSADSLGDQMRGQFTTLGGIFATGLSDASAPVRLAALKAVQSLVQWLETDQEMQMGSEMVPRLLAVAQQCLDVGDDDTPIQVGVPLPHRAPRWNACTRVWCLVMRAQGASKSLPKTPARETGGNPDPSDDVPFSCCLVCCGC